MNKIGHHVTSTLVVGALNALLLTPLSGGAKDLLWLVGSALAYKSSDLPDVIETNFWRKPRFRRRLIAHRTITHSGLLSLISGAASLVWFSASPGILSFLINSLIWSYVTHVLVDAGSPMGIPWGIDFHNRRSLNLYQNNKITKSFYITIMALILIPFIVLTI